MTLLFHPGYNPNSNPPGTPIASDVVAQFEGTASLCEKLIALWSETEIDFRVVARCRTRVEAKKIIKSQRLRLLR